MWDMDSYQESLREHTSDHHPIGSALVLLVAVGILLLILV